MFSNFGFPFLPVSVIQKHCDSRAAYEDIADNTVYVGDLTEEEKAEYRGKNHLSIVIDRDFLCGSADICAGYSELTYSRACARANQTQKALKAHYGEF